MFLHLRKLYTLNILSLSNKGYSPEYLEHLFDGRYPPVIKGFNILNSCRFNQPTKLQELLMRIELTTSSLPRKCSTTELQQPFFIKSSVELTTLARLAPCSTTELQQPFFAVNRYPLTVIRVLTINE